MRFPEFSDSYHESTLGEIFEYERPDNYIVSSEKYSDSFPIPVLTANQAFVLGYTNETTGIYDKGPVILFDDFTCDMKYADFPFKVKSSAMKLLTPKEGIPIFYAYNLLQHINYKPEGHARHWISIMQPIKVSLPCHIEQKRISEFLSLVCKRIEKHQMLIAALKKYKRGVIQVIFDDEKRDLFGEISSGKQVKLSDLMDFQNGINADASKYGRGIRFISVSDILKNNFITYDKIIGQVDIDNRTLMTYSVTYGDVLFQRSSETREDAGRSNVYLDTEKTATFGGFVIRGKKKSDYDPLYLKYALDSFVVRKQIMQCAAGAQHINVSQEDLCKVVVNLPTIDVQNRISKFISDIDLRIATEEKKANAQAILKKALLQQLFI